MNNFFHKLIFILIASGSTALVWAADQPPTSATPASVNMPPVAPTSATPTTPATPLPPAKVEALDDRIQDIKSDVIKLNRDLLVLEEELLFPANTQVV